jgi:hypothetical protein
MVPPESPSTASRASPRWLSSPRPGALTSCTGGGGLQEGGRRQLLQARPATARVAAGGGELAFLCADCNGGCDGTAWVPVEGFSGCPATAELGASWGLDLLHGRQRASRWRHPAGRRGASRRQRTLSEARTHPAQHALPRRAWRRERQAARFSARTVTMGAMALPRSLSRVSRAAPWLPSLPRPGALTSCTGDDLQGGRELASANASLMSHTLDH